MRSPDDWERVDEDLLEFAKQLIALRRDHPVFRRRRWFSGRPIRGTVDVGWFKHDGTEMNDSDWGAGFARSVGLFLNGEAITDRDRRGQQVTDNSFLLLFNAHSGPADWSLPEQWGKRWEAIFDTSIPEREGDSFDAGLTIPVAGRSMVVFRRIDTQP